MGAMTETVAVRADQAQRVDQTRMALQALSQIMDSAGNMCVRMRQHNLGAHDLAVQPQALACLMSCLADGLELQVAA